RAFPTGVRWTLVADRGFPSAALFAQLRQGGTDFSVRLRLSDWVTVGKVSAMVVDHLEAGRRGGGDGRRRRWAAGGPVGRRWRERAGHMPGGCRSKRRTGIGIIIGLSGRP